MRSLLSFSVFLTLFPAGLVAQTASPFASTPILGAASEAGELASMRERAISALSLPADMTWTGLTPVPNPRPDLGGLSAVPSRSEMMGGAAFIKAAPLSGVRGSTTRDRVALMLLSLAVHAAVTWDAQSTNDFFHHCPPGYRPAEVDPLMRPFAGKAAMYPMANLLFAAPFDLLLYKTRHGQKLTRGLTYMAASTWVGLEIQQSLVNMRHEHISSGR